MSKWRAVITMMIGRLTEHPVLDQQAERRGIKLSWSDKHWLGAYVFRKAYKLLEENAMPSKMLACSMRDGPMVNGKYHFWDVEKLPVTLFTRCLLMFSSRFLIVATI